MKLGIAGLFPSDTDRLACAAQIGYDFIESGLSILHQRYSASDIKEFADYLSALKLPCISTNGMFPGEVKLIGKDADPSAIENYLHEVFTLIAPLNTEVCVLGSGNARRIPEGYSVEKAYDEFARLIAQVIAPIAEQYGKIIAIEPLNYSECNIVNTVADSMRVVRAVNRPSVRTLIDFYHVRYNGEDVESFAEYKGYIEHVHVASFNHHRRFPRPFDGEDYRGFFRVLRQAGYARETVSIEAGESGGFVDFKNAALSSYDLLKAL